MPNEEFKPSDFMEKVLKQLSDMGIEVVALSPDELMSDKVKSLDAADQASQCQCNRCVGYSLEKKMNTPPDLSEQPFELLRKLAHSLMPEGDAEISDAVLALLTDIAHKIKAAKKPKPLISGAISYLKAIEAKL